MVLSGSHRGIGESVNVTRESEEERKHILE
jgi:hypothetical protein